MSSKRIFSSIASIIVTLGCMTATGEVNVLPTPVTVQTSDGNYRLPSQATVSTSDTSLMPAAEYLKQTLQSCIDLKLGTSDTHSDIALQLATGLKKEGAYTLKCDHNGIVISGADYQGVINGIATLFQLLPPEIFSGNMPAGLTVRHVSITDAPRFQWRGYMLDCGRHFFTVAEVKKVLDLMALFKLNRFHWHITDHQGWRVEIKQYPQLTEIGAWRALDNALDNACEKSAMEHSNANLLVPTKNIRIANGVKQYGGYYTQDEIRSIVAYAAQRGIEVIPEVDMPGHLNSAIEVFPWLSCSEKFNGSVCPGRDSVLQFCKNVYSEIFSLFPSKIIHIGGDEVDKSNWKTCPDCQRRIKELNLTGENGLQAWFIREMEKYFNENGRQLIGWDEISHDNLSSNSAIMWWRADDNSQVIEEATAQGMHVVASPTSCMYVDFPHDDKSIDRILDFDPARHCATRQQEALVWGVQCNMWTEFVPSDKHMEYMTWPRLLALSETAWAQPGNKLNGSNFIAKAADQFKRLDALKVNYHIPILSGIKNNNVFIDSDTLKFGSDLDRFTIRYTTNGSEPTIHSPRYTTPIIVTGTTHFKISPFNADGLKTDTYNANFVKTSYKPAVKGIKPKHKGLQASEYAFHGMTCDSIALSHKIRDFVA